MEKLINDIKNFNNINNDENIKNQISLLEKELEIAKKENDQDGIKYLEKRINKLKGQLNTNFIKKYLIEIENANDDEIFNNAIPTKIKNETKEKFKEIAKKMGVKQGVLFGSLVKYFVDEYCKRYPEDCK
jgi:tetrahydromethanopterin S-methyltransferase subunit G